MKTYFNAVLFPSGDKAMGVPWKAVMCNLKFNIIARNYEKLNWSMTTPLWLSSNISSRLIEIARCSSNFAVSISVLHIKSASISSTEKVYIAVSVADTGKNFRKIV